MALGTGASFGVTNVFLADMKNAQAPVNDTLWPDFWWFPISGEESSWIGKASDIPSTSITKQYV